MVVQQVLVRRSLHLECMSSGAGSSQSLLNPLSSRPHLSCLFTAEQQSSVQFVSLLCQAAASIGFYHLGVFGIGIWMFSRHLSFSCLSRQTNHFSSFPVFSVFVASVFVLIFLLCFIAILLSLQMSEGLTFLHSGVKMVHGNLCPENIILNKSGAWKIMGFDFSISTVNPSDAEVGLGLARSSRLTRWEAPTR